MTEFLIEFDGVRRSWRDADGAAEERGIYTAMSLSGPGADALEVAYAVAETPTSVGVREIWKERHGRAAAPLLVAVGYPREAPTRALLCGPTGDNPHVADVEISQAERLAAAALAEPNRHLAIRFLIGALDGDPNSLPGVRNKGLLATHALEKWVPEELDWHAASERSRPLLAKRDHDLVRGLGYQIENKGNHQILRASATDAARAVAVFLEATEQPDTPSARFGNQTPVTAALTSADRENLRWVIAVRGGTVRLYSTDTSGAAGQRGRAETYVELNLPILPTDQAGYLDLLFSADALADGGTVARIQEASADYASELSKRLRERVYNEVVPRLAVAVADQVGGTSEADLQRHYRTALTIMFRLLFVAYAEDSRLLPLHVNGDYTDHALKSRARRIADKINAGQDLGFDNPLTAEIEPTTDPGLTDLWTDCLDLFHAVDKGHPGWGVPAYNGGLFSPDPEVNPVGGTIDGLTLTNGDFGPALTALLVDKSPDGTIGPIDFRSLSVREFGTIYEGLLESELSVAEQPLTLDKDGTYVPASGDDQVIADEGDVYLHNASGARKSSGAYFTKPFAVGHLLDHALEPTLDEHLVRVSVALDEGRETDAADMLFDFRVADIAMGSGHFLTAVVDRLEARYSTFLSDHPIAGITKQLAALRAAAVDALGGFAESLEIENTSLLRRLIARRCVYGADINPISVELARVSMWIHTFVPGLPLSFLDHNLVVGNSLSGIATVEEATTELTSEGTQASLFDDPVREGLAKAAEPLRRLATITDRNAADIQMARQAAAEAAAAVEPITRVFDLITAHRLGEIDQPVVADIGEADNLLTDAVRDRVRVTRPLHFPVAFPEVFLRDRPGFDVLVGNPPWEEATVERDAFWAIRFPGLRGLPENEKTAAVERLASERADLHAAYEKEVAEAEALRAVLLHGPYPGMGTGDPDLYKAFSWRFWHLLRDGGRTGVVLPRSAVTVKGTTPWREALLKENALARVDQLTNHGEWIFADVHQQYSIVLVTIVRGRRTTEPIRIFGPYYAADQYSIGCVGDGVVVDPADFARWTPTSSVPLLPSEEAARVFAKLRSHMPVSELPFKFVTELHATNDKPHMVLDAEDADGLWPVYKGASFDIWNPKTGTIYAWADPAHITAHLHDKRSRQTGKKGAFHGMPTDWLLDPETLPCLAPRLAFRDITNRENYRTTVPCLLPGEVLLTNKAPYLHRRPEASAADEAFLLGVMCSRIFDWQSRCTIERSLNLYILDPLALPWPDADNRLRKIVIEIAGRLAAVDERYAVWAADVGVPVSSVQDGQERDELLVALEAAVAALYGLTEGDVRLIYSTFHPNWQHKAFTDAVLAQMNNLGELDL